MSAEEALVVVPCAAFLAMGLFPFLHAVVQMDFRVIMEPHLQISSSASTIHLEV